MITIIDYGMGNLGSVSNMFKRIGAASEVTGDLELIGKSTKLLLPGVGAFDNAMSRINSSGLREVLDQRVLRDRIPILGICLGMQLLTRFSEEGSLPGLGWIEGETIRFPSNLGIKVPHMGWNVVTPTQNSRLTEGLPPDSRFYFVHSYFVKVDRSENSILRASHGLDFDAAIEHENIFGAQFHPEKSHKFGMRLLTNFAEM